MSRKKDVQDRPTDRKRSRSCKLETQRRRQIRALKYGATEVTR